MSVDFPLPPIAITEHQVAACIGMSVHWLRKDRRTKRLLPFYKLGDSVRYDLERVRQALQRTEEGGAGAVHETRPGPRLTEQNIRPQINLLKRSKGKFPSK